MLEQVRHHPMESILALLAGGLWVWLIIHHPFIGLAIVLVIIGLSILVAHQK